MIETGLKNKVVLVTGANSGIGASIAKAFAREGSAVIVHYLAELAGKTDSDAHIEHTILGKTAADEIVGFIERQGGRAVAIDGDLSDSSTIPLLFDSAENVFGQVDVLINNAAHCETPDTIFTVTPGSIDRHFAVNTRAVVLLIAEFVRRYQKRDGQSGKIINISTDAAQTFASQISYGASKAAIEAYTRSIAIEVGSLGITVNTIAPGPVQTGWITPELEEQVVPLIPLRSIGQPEDIADAAVFLAAKQSRWITGQVIKVSGGNAL